MRARQIKLSLRLAGIIAGLCVVLAFGARAWMSSDVTASQGGEAEVEFSKPNYSEFPHNAKAHQIECANCHKFPSSNWQAVRPEKDAFPDISDYPKHDSCLKCHQQQFFKGTPPKVCSICHTTPGPRISTRWPFPNPREAFDKTTKGQTHESDFLVGFPHDKHIEIVSGHGSPVPRFVAASYTSRRIAGEESCKVCHQTMAPLGNSTDEYLTKPPAKLGDGFWLKKGTFKSAPIGHTTCFTCHNADSGVLPAPTTCSGCHHLKPPLPKADFDAAVAKPMGITDKVMLDNWKRRTSSGKFAHEFVAHVDMECATCHTVTKMDTADPKTKTVPISSCATCHATATTADGGAINYEVDQRKANPKFECVKCHVAFGKLAIPDSHLKALAAAK